MQRVLFVVGDHYSERFDPRILGQAKIFMLKGWDVTILCTSNSTKNEKIVKENIRFILVNSQNRFLFSHAIHTKFLKFKNYRFLRKIVLKLKFECAKIGQIVFPKIIESPKNELRYLLKIKRIADMDFDLVVACDMSAYLTLKKFQTKSKAFFGLTCMNIFQNSLLVNCGK